MSPVKMNRFRQMEKLMGRPSSALQASALMTCHGTFTQQRLEPRRF